MRHRQPVLGPGWAPMAPAVAPRLWPKIRRQLIILGGLTLIALFTGVLASPRGGLAVLLAWALMNLLTSRPAKARTMLEWGAVTALAVIVATATTGAKVTAPQLKAPVTVDAAQTDQLEKARSYWAKVAGQLGQAFTEAREGASKEGP